MTELDAVQAWTISAADDWDTAKKLLEANKYAHSLFFKAHKIYISLLNQLS